MSQSLEKGNIIEGRIIEGQLVLGAICCETKEMFLVTVPSRDKETLIPIIKDRIKPGTTILSDCWKSYDCLEKKISYT